jgi:RHS repeat-associated protein
MNQFIKTLLSIALPAVLLCNAAHADTITRTSSYEYDANGLLTKETVEPDSPNDCLQTAYAYNDVGSKTSTAISACVGASGYVLSSASATRTTTMAYDGRGRFPQVRTNPLGQTDTAGYESKRGELTGVVDANGQQTNWNYDAFARKTQEQRKDGTKTTWTYLLCTDAGANCPATVGPATVKWVLVEQAYQKPNNGNPVNTPEKRQFYDSLGRVVRLQTQGFDGGGTAPVIVQDTIYNAQGQVAQTSQPYALSGGSPVWTSYQYDALGRVTQQSSPDSAAPGGTAITTYSYNGLTTSSTNTNNQTKTASKDSRGQVHQVVDAKGSAITYSYDAVGNLTQVNVAGSITTIGYNQRGLKTSMIDPAMGSWIYAYNAFGELVYQRDSLNRATTMDYDALGRMIKRTEPDLVSQWSFDKRFDGTVCGNKTAHKLCEAIADNGYRRLHTYDTFARPTTTSTVLDDPANPAAVTEVYDQYRGLVTSKTWPTGAKATYAYTPLGYLSSVTATASVGSGTKTVTYTVLAVNAQGQITQYKTGNNVTTVKNFDAQTNRLVGITATLTGQSTGNVLNQAYTFDALGNLLTRADNTPGIGTQENFSYDAVNRLTMAFTNGGAVSPPQITEVMYDDRGNITYKSDVGTYWYDAARPNRMTNVTLEAPTGSQVALSGTRALSYAFDDTMAGAQTINGVTVGNGNLQYTVSQDTTNNLHTVRGESYTSYNMPQQIVFGNFISATTSSADRTVTFVYSPEHQRSKKTLQLSGNGTSAYTSGTTYYMNGVDSLGLSFEKEITASGLVQNKHYVSAGGQVFAMLVTRTGNIGTQTAVTSSYMQTDYLGSVASITDGTTGAVVERLAYDPWGKRRNTNGNIDPTDALTGATTQRGYTMQEHLDEIGVINMNARVYDPLVGRFMSADSIIPNPADMKAFNRYSYVNNNPLRAMDPTGHDPFDIGGGFGGSSFDFGFGGSGFDFGGSSYGLGGSNSSGLGGSSFGFGSNDASLNSWNGFQTNYQSWDIGSNNNAVTTYDSTLIADAGNTGLSGTVTDAGSGSSTYQFSLGVSGTAFIPLTPLGLPALGLGGGTNFGLQTDGTLAGTSFFVQGQANAMVGSGAFLGIGLIAGYAHTNPLTTGFDNSGYFELDGGWGAAVSYSGAFDGTNLTGTAAGLPVRLMPGLGYGFGWGVGGSWTATAVSPTIGEILSVIVDLLTPNSSQSGPVGDAQ